MPQRTGRLLARNTLYNLVGQGAPLVAAAFAVPLLLRDLGPGRFGVLALAWLVLGFFTEAGLGRAATRFAARARGRGDGEAFRSVVWITAGAQALFGVVAAAALAAASGLLVQHVHVGAALHASGREALLVVAAFLPLVALVAVFRGPLEAAERFDVINAAVLPASLANYLLPLAALGLGWDLPGLVGLVVGSRVALLATYIVADLRLFPEIRGRPRLARADVAAVLSFGGWSSVSSFVSPILVSLDRFLLAALVSTAALGYYAAPYEMATRLLMVPVSLVAALYPAVSALGAARDSHAVERLAGHSMKALALVMGPVAILIIALGPELLRVWLGPVAARETALAVRILGVGVLVNAIAQVPFTLLQGMGRADVTAKFHLLELAAYAGGAALLVRGFGIAGAASAWTLRVSVDAVLLLGALHTLAPETARGLVRMRVPHALLPMLALAPVLVLLSALLPPGASAWACAGGFLLAGAGTWRFGLTAAERALVPRLAGRLVTVLPGFRRAEPMPALAAAAPATRPDAVAGGPAQAPPRAGSQAAGPAGGRARAGARGRTRLLVIGPTPPPSHGVAVYTRLLLDSPALRDGCRIVHMDTADRRTLENLGRFDPQNIVLALRHSLQLALLLARHRPQAVYLPISRNKWAYLRDAAFIALARLAGARVITHLHGSDLRLFLDGATPPWRALVRWSTRRLHVAAVLTPRLECMYAGLLPSSRVAVVPPAIVDPFPAGAPLRRRAPGSPLTVAYLSALYEGKGYLDLLEAARLALGEGLALRLRVAGGWLSEEERARGLSALRRLGLEGCVEFVGFLEGAAKAAFLAGADVFVFPGTQAEGLPLAVLEAMAAGLPVVATENGALPDAVVEGETGLVVPRHDPAALAGAIRRLAGDAELRQRMGRAGRAHFLEHFTISRAAGALTAVVEQACAG